VPEVKVASAEPEARTGRPAMAGADANVLAEARKLAQAASGLKRWR